MDQHDPDLDQLSAEAIAQRDAVLRKIDQLSKRPSERTVDDKVVQLEATVGRLAQVVSTLTLTVSRLADERLGQRELADPDPLDVTADPDDG